MTELSRSTRDDLPSTTRLLRASGIATAVAAVLLITAVLPAEYGIDPTGIGGRLGLAVMGKAGMPPATEGNRPTSGPSALSAVWRSPKAYHSETKTFTLKPNRGVEIKARMDAGERFVFSWKVDGGVVSFDMHGDKLNAAKDEFTSFWTDEARSEGYGAFEAPFDGNHGWYWKNKGEQPVTLTLEVAGYFEKLFRP